MTYMHDALLEPKVKPAPTPSPYAKYPKDRYRVVSAGSQLRVEEWSEPSKKWGLKLYYSADRFRVEETPVRFEIYRKTSDESETTADAPLMDRVSMATKLRDARFVQSIQLKAMNAISRLRHGQNPNGGR